MRWYKFEAAPLQLLYENRLVASQSTSLDCLSTLLSRCFALKSDTEATVKIVQDAASQ